MTEGEKVFYKRRLQEETRSAKSASCARERDLHLAWVAYFDGRLDGKRVPEPPPVPGYYLT